MKPDGTDIQATITYNYQYKDASNPFNFVGTSSAFKGVTTPLSTKQYVDGLGRPIEVVKESYTPANGHQKSYLSYDALGRQNKTYLPFESTTLSMENPPAYTSSFVLTEFEASPLSRPVKQTQVDNTTTLTAYGANIANEVRIWTPTNGNGNTVVSNAYYLANTLSKTIVTNENGKLTCIFKDKLGRVILTRKVLGTQNVDTYNVYDDYGQLVAVLPPGSFDDYSGTVTESLTFWYKYDEKQRLIQKKVPGAEVQKFYYDNRDLITLTQDGNLVSTGINNYMQGYNHIGTQYDDLGRVIRTGLVYTNSPLTYATSGFTILDGPTKLTEIQYYPNKSWVKNQGAKVLKPNGVSTPTEFVWSYIERRVGLEYTGNPVWTGKQHLMHPTVAQRPIDDNDVYGVDWSLSVYNGMQQADWSARFAFINGNTGQQVRTRADFTYDNGRRMTDMKYSYGLDGAAYIVPTYTLANMVYNYKDQLTEKNIGYATSATQALQSIDYLYNLRGWLEAINNVTVYPNQSTIYTAQSLGTGGIQNLAITPYINKAMKQVKVPFNEESIAEETPPVADYNADLFNQKLYYYSNADGRFQAPPQYNGNIQATAWQVAGRSPQGYGFTYDDLDRLTNAKYFDITNSGGGITAGSSAFSSDYKFNESANYDLRGNITSLQRNGRNGGTWTTNGSWSTNVGWAAATYGLIDNLSYTYNSQNQVTKVTDASLANFGFIYKNASVTTSYTYDANGNLKSDANKGITNIEYNHLNLPMRITFNRLFPSTISNGIIEFIYDATGAKLKKLIKDPNGVVLETTDYIDGIEYKNGVLQRFAHTEGAVVRQSNATYIHEYSLRDHLGNTRVTFSDANNDGIVGTADIKQINHYYPFGLNMEGDWNGATGVNKYQYNGKEWNDDFGLGWNDYGARFYDPAVARWHSVDPHASRYSNMSPYNYGNNNPIFFIDTDGRDAIGSIDGNTITIKSVIYITGHNATTEKAASIQKGIMETWGKDFSYKDGDVPYNVKYDIQVMIATDDKNALDKLSDGENLVTLLDESKGEITSSVYNGRDGQWGEDESDKTYSHEAGHFLMVDDLYYYDDAGEIHNYKGVDEYDNMGMNAHDEKSSVSQKTINEMAKYILDNKDKSNKTVIESSKVTFRDNTKLEKE